MRQWKRHVFVVPAEEIILLNPNHRTFNRFASCSLVHVIAGRPLLQINRLCFVLMILILCQVLSIGAQAMKQEALAWDGEVEVQATRDMAGVVSTGYRVSAQKPGEQAHGGVADVLQQDRLRGT